MLIELSNEIVYGPTMPSALRFLAFWNLITEALVRGPKFPTTGPLK